MKPQTLSAGMLALAILLRPALAADSAPTAVHSDDGPHTCDSYLPAGFVLPPSAQTTLISYHVGPAGKLSAVSLYRSSGNSDLDKAALACVSGQHEESSEAVGKPIEATWIGGVFWGSGFHSFGLSSPTGQPNLCPSYPPIAVRMNQEGTATVTFQIATDGRVKDVALAKSTGYPVLDKATLDCVAAYRYFPVMQNGQPIATDRTVSVAWRLMQPPIYHPQCPYSAEALKTGAEGTATIQVHITDEGKVSNVNVIESTGTKALDDSAVSCAEKWRYKPALMNGKPVASRKMYKLKFIWGSGDKPTQSASSPDANPPTPQVK